MERGISSELCSGTLQRSYMSRFPTSGCCWITYPRGISSELCSGTLQRSYMSRFPTSGCCWITYPYRSLISCL
ncbi:hypothetical protein TNCT_430151 [Trichonephila clavata]|uniref:Uncharacterized protein n=1 Tax=Trichonephila clavata TaxID=2740835 RepID=A0A8X6FIC1_TRICU|nr:hypothetical protein TNCT_430151 [Trichonephila clavata]